MKLKLLLTVCLFTPCLSLANVLQDKDLVAMLQSFTHCDGQFFTTLNNNQYNQYFQLTVLNNKQSSMLTEVQSSTELSQTRIQSFNSPIKFGNLNIVSYIDMRSIFADDEKYFYWGFRFNNSIEEVKSALFWINWHKDKEQFYIADPLIYKNGQWSSNPYAASGIEPEKDTAEKVLLLESSSSNNEVSIYCSVQGNIPPSELTKIRPDL